MPANIWEQKKKNALDLLKRLLNAWHGQMHLDDIDSLGPQVNNAVLMLELKGIQGLIQPVTSVSKKCQSLPVNHLCL